MLWIELALSTATLLSIWMITNRKRGGVRCGLGLQLIWLYYWIFVTRQYGFILIDFGIVFIYADRLIKNYKQKNLPGASC